jgi:molecular chaperone DnaK
MADGLIFNSEKQLKEYGDKIPADEKSKIEEALTKLKDAHKSEDLDAMDKAMEDLNAAWQTASQHIYNAQQQAGDQGQQQGPEAASNNDGGVADAEYEEVK